MFITIFFSPMKITQLILPALILVGSIPSAFAAELGDAMQRTFETDQWSYTSTADVKLSKSQAADVPFDMTFNVQEEGGKRGTQYAEKGQLSLDVSNVETADWSDFSSLNVLMKYRGDYEDRTQTAYVLFDTLQVSSDSSSFQQTMDMLNEMAKLFTGKAFKLSSQELAQALLKGGIASPDELMALNALSGHSLQSMMGSFVQAFDGLIESGVLIDRVESDSSRRRSGESTQRHVLSLGRSITPQQAEQLRSTLMKFFEEMVPLLASEINTELQYMSSQEIATEINEALETLRAASLQATLEISAGVIQSLDFDFDLTTLELPVHMTGQVDFDYSKGYSSVVPRDEKNMIDLNKIIEGFMAQFGSSSYETPQPYFYEERDSYSVYPYTYPPTTVDFIYGDILNAQTNCIYDQRCRRREMRNILMELNKLKRAGIISSEDHSHAAREVRRELR